LSSTPPVAVSGDPRTQRIRIDLAYEGTDFSGWARQPGRRTVQETLEVALGTALRLPQPPPVTVAGRTDAGVHARGQVAHVDAVGDGDAVSDAATPSRRWLNALLPADVRVSGVRVAPPGFDARFSALARRYSYRIADTGPVRQDPLRRRDTLSWPRHLDGAAMHEAAQGLLGEHDFAAFCRRREGATTIRRLLEFGWTRGDDGVLTATVRADAFCHSMVRALVGACIAVGEGRRGADWPATVLAAGVRASEVHVVPPHGLCLEEVTYPPDAELAERANVTRRVRTRAPIR
jgi:tRNA pseudouridine38-40 synthase